MAAEDAPKPPRTGRLFLRLALGLLIGAGAAAGWLHYTDRLEPLLAAAPRVDLELPLPTETAAEATETAAAPSPSEAPTATTADAAPASSEATSTDTMASETPAAADPAADTAAQTDSGETLSTATLQPPPAAAPAPGDMPADAEAADATGAEAAPASDTAEAPAEGDAAETAAAEAEPSGTTEAAPGIEAGTSAAATEMAAATPPPAPAPTLAPPWKRYARPFPMGDSRPRIAIVIAELGLSRAATEAAIERLPPEITLAFNPMAQNLQAWIIKARARGHEVMLDLPMEPLAYPQEDPGPNALLASLGPIENARRLEFLLGRADGYVGVASYMGSRFEGSAELIEPVLRTLADRGLLFLANRSGPSTEVPALAKTLDLPWISNDRFLDTEATRVAIDGRLQQLERVARTHQGAIAIGLGYPVTIERVGAWAETLGAKGITLAPASALVGLAQR